MQHSDNRSNRQLYKRILVRGALVVVGVLFLLLVLPGILRLAMPFVIAFFVAGVLNPFVDRINRRFGVSRRIIALVLDLIVFFAVFSAIGALVYATVSEALSLANTIQLDWQNITAKFDGLSERFAWLFAALPSQVVDLFNSFEESIMEFLQNLSKNLLSTVLSATGTMTTKTGSFFLKFFMAMLAAYFTITDYSRITAMIKRFLGRRITRYASLLGRSVRLALSGYIKSQLLLALFAFVFMFVALTIYQQPYALLLALFLGIIDLLPIVGTIAVLAPWGIIEWASGDMNKGIFLLVIGVGYFLIRKVVEPKIVGSQTGLHPLAALLSIYVGLQFSGIWGAILGPMVLMLLINIARSGIFDNTVKDIRALADILSAALTRPPDEEAGDSADL